MRSCAVLVLLAATAARADAPAPRARPQVTMGVPMRIEGPRMAKDLHRSLAAAFNGFRGCYEMAWKGNPSLDGAIELHVLVDLRGAVEDAQARLDTVRSEPLSLCMQRHMRTIKFGTAAAAAQFDVRFTFATAW